MFHKTDSSAAAALAGDSCRALTVTDDYWCFEKVLVAAGFGIDLPD